MADLTEFDHYAPSATCAFDFDVENDESHVKVQTVSEVWRENGEVKFPLLDAFTRNMQTVHRLPSAPPGTAHESTDHGQARALHPKNQTDPSVEGGTLFDSVEGQGGTLFDPVVGQGGSSSSSNQHD